MQPCIEQKKFSYIKVSDRVHFGLDKFWEQPIREYKDDIFTE
jgi:hypothetical protein